MHKDFLKNFQFTFYNELFYALKRHNLTYTQKTYLKNQMIAVLDSPCIAIGIILSGEAEIQHWFQDGTKKTIHSLSHYDIFGELLLFSEAHSYPYPIVATQKSEILFITKEIMLKLFKEEPHLLEQFLSHISNSYMNLNSYVKLISQKTIETKLAYYFIHYGNVSTIQPVCMIKTKTNLAAFIGVERGSLIRELNRLKSQNMLEYDQKSITIRQFQHFKSIIE